MKGINVALYCSIVKETLNLAFDTHPKCGPRCLGCRGLHKLLDLTEENIKAIVADSENEQVSDPFAAGGPLSVEKIATEIQETYDRIDRVGERVRDGIARGFKRTRGPVL